MSKLGWLICSAAATVIVAGVPAWAQSTLDQSALGRRLIADKVRRYVGVYSADCGNTNAPRLRVVGDSLIVEQGTKRMTGRIVQTDHSFFGRSGAPEFEVALEGTLSTLRPGLGLFFVVYRGESGVYITIGGAPEVEAALGKSLLARKYRSCDPVRIEITSAPPSPRQSESMTRPRDLLMDSRFKSAYYKALGPKIKEDWLARLDGPAESNRTIKIGGTEYILAVTCKTHDCGDNQVVLLYSAAQGVVYGKIVQQTLIGSPPPTVAAELDRLWVPNTSAMSNVAGGTTLASTGDTPPAFVTAWGTSGSGDGQFNGPIYVAVDGSGNVYVADETNNRIQKFSNTGTYLTQWGTTGTGNGQFNRPWGVAVDASGNVYVVDFANYRIQKFSSTGTYLTQWGTLGRGNGQFLQASGVAVDGSGNVYVVDSQVNRIQKFSSTGTYLTQWGTSGPSGTGNGQFSSPDGVAVDGSGNVYVADTNNFRIQKFSNTGTYLTQWGTSGAGNGQFNLPWGVAVDGSGNVYVTDQGNYRIQKFTNTGTYLTQLGSSGSGNGQFTLPRGVAVDGSGNVYVTDDQIDRIQKFSPVP